MTTKSETNPDLQSPDGQLDEDICGMKIDETSINKYASYKYINPEFFTPKEIATMTMTVSMQMLAFVARRGRGVTENDIKIAQDRAALLIGRCLDDKLLQQSFMRAKESLGLQNDVLIQARRRLGEAMGETED